MLLTACLTSCIHSYLSLTDRCLFDGIVRYQWRALLCCCVWVRPNLCLVEADKWKAQNFPLIILWQISPMGERQRTRVIRIHVSVSFFNFVCVCVWGGSWPFVCKNSNSQVESKFKTKFISLQVSQTTLGLAFYPVLNLYSFNCLCIVMINWSLKYDFVSLFCVWVCVKVVDRKFEIQIPLSGKEHVDVLTTYLCLFYI